jgi:dienelactone hydrolase/pimeloyl-ACP methyl ester carboxylesterase
MPRNGYAQMVQDHYVRRVREIARERAGRLRSIKTRKQALAYQDDVRVSIRKALGTRPRKTALNPQIVDAIERRGFRIEKILFESRPGCLVTANLYIPNKIDGLAPGVIASCGHSAEGKAAPIYQEFCQRLALSGFVTLIFDPFNQGERDQYYKLSDREIVRSSTHAHNMMGKQLDLIGEWFGAWRGWDAIRALDYLLTRPEVDPDRIGLTGNSGGGTMTTWVWGVEERFAFAAPSCFVTTFAHNLENELPADSEQYPPGVIGRGLDMADFMLAQAPKPVMLLGQKYCFFDRRGLKDASEDVRRFYSLVGAPNDNTGYFLGPEGHGYSSHNQKAMVRFFAHHAGAKVNNSSPVTLSVPELNVTPKGEVIDAGATPIFDLIQAKADGLLAKRKRLSTSQLKQVVTKVLCLPSPTPDIPHYRCLRSDRISGKVHARYAIETEPDIRVLLRKTMESPHTHTLDVEREVTLFLPHLSSESDLAIDPLARQLAKTDPIYGLDVRGLGESMPDDSRDFFHAYGVDYMHNGYGQMLGQSYLGRRVLDVLRTIGLLVSEGATKVHLVGRGQGAVLATYAGLLHGKTGSITLKNGPLSYQEWTQTPLVSWPFANFPSGCLKHFDLSDLIRSLGKRATLVQPWGPAMQPYTRAQLSKAIDKTTLSGIAIR